MKPLNNILRYLLCLLLITLNITCTKSADTKTFGGVLLNNCKDLKPLSGVPVRLIQRLSNSTTGGLDVLAETTTDADGKFSMTYNAGGGQSLTLQTPVGGGFGTIRDNIPRNINASNLVIISAGSLGLTVRIQPTRVYSDKDTLVYLNQRTRTIIRRAGPFVADTLYTVADAYMPGLPEPFDSLQVSAEARLNGQFIKSYANGPNCGSVTLTLVLP